MRWLHNKWTSDVEITKYRIDVFFVIFLNNSVFFITQGPTSNDVGHPESTSPKKGVKFKIENYSDFDDSDLDIENLT